MGVVAVHGLGNGGLADTVLAADGNGERNVLVRWHRTPPVAAAALVLALAAGELLDHDAAAGVLTAAELALAGATAALGERLAAERALAAAGGPREAKLRVKRIAVEAHGLGLFAAEEDATDRAAEWDLLGGREGLARIDAAAVADAKAAGVGLDARTSAVDLAPEALVHAVAAQAVGARDEAADLAAAGRDALELGDGLQLRRHGRMWTEEGGRLGC